MQVAKPDPACRSAMLVAPLVLVGAAALLLALAPDAHADHGFGGSLEIESIVGAGEPMIKVSGFLSFQTTDTVGIGSAGCNTVTADTSYPYYPVQFGYMAMQNTGLPIQVNGGLEIPFGITVVYVDSATAAAGGHCRFVGRIMGPDGASPLIVPLPPSVVAAGEVEVVWTLSARDDANHVNNGGKDFRLAAKAPVLQSAAAPITRYNETTQITDHGNLGYGNHHCPQPGICYFWVPAYDPDGDAMTWRLASANEADPDGDFIQPDGLSIDAVTGLARWDTTTSQVYGGVGPGVPPNPGEIYSAQFIVEDPTSSVPIDIVIEVIPGESCPDGTPKAVDPWTGEFLPCETDPCVLDPTLDECLPICERSDAPRDCFPVPPPTTGVEPEWHFWPPEEPRPFAPPTVSGAFEPPVRFNDVEGDGMGDSDRDGIKDHADMCPGVAGGDVDFDLDGRGDACDPDDDNDGVVDEMDCDHPDLACTVEETAVRPVAEGSEGSRGARTSSSALPAGGAAVELKEADARSATPAWILGGIAAAMFLLVIAASRGRRTR